jgi:hypothetical protein
LTLEVTPVKDWHLERWRLLDRLSAVEDALGCPVALRETEAPTAVTRSGHGRGRRLIDVRSDLTSQAQGPAESPTSTADQSLTER